MYLTTSKILNILHVFLLGFCLFLRYLLVLFPYKSEILILYLLNVKEIFFPVIHLSCNSDYGSFYHIPFL